MTQRWRLLSDGAYFRDSWFVNPSSQSAEPVIAPGANILVRDAAWRVQQVDRTSSGGLLIEAVGLSELVEDKEAIFLSEYEPSIEVLDPAETDLVADESSKFQASLLYLESQLRQVPPTDEKIYVGHQAAMDRLDFQLQPAAQALQQTRQRMLIADAVGLGKTVEAGILLSELIERGKAKRILVVAVKSMLTQFQKELWSRFTIPLTRLDSVGLQRIRQQIPTNQNPFHYYDKSIISVDTLKQNNEYRTYLEDAYWDVIVIDEAQNVAVRGKKKSQRAKLAELLSHRSDSLLMLSATPHDGKAKSFASLMNMLDPTAIADPENYTPDDIQRRFIRRFKKDVADQVAESFSERQIYEVGAEASEAEERAYDAFAELEFESLDQRGGGHMLFKTSLEKALFSSPAACIETIDNRITKLERKIEKRDAEDAKVTDYRHDIAHLERLREKLEAIGPDNYAKYQCLVELLDEEPFDFTGWLKEDRLVIFTERIATMEWLAEHLPEALELKEKKVRTLHGSMSDIEQQHVVEEFGQKNSDARLLIASDVASEGINLHYMCHRMVHFDIPWSLMVFQQRNGRIDRYGQTDTPHIAYLLTESDNERISGDTRILELLINKDDQASQNIGDPSALMGVYDIDEQERQTAEAIESHEGPDAFDQQLQEMDFMSKMLEKAEEAEEKTRPRTDHMPSLYESDFAYLHSALDFLRGDRPLEFDADPDQRRISLLLNDAVDNLERRLEKLPEEVEPDHGERVILTADTEAMQESIRASRAEETAWPEAQYLWRQSPVVRWANDRMAGNFGRHSAPVIQFPADSPNDVDGLAPNETVFVVSGLIPNRRSQPLIHQWFGVVFRDGEFDELESFEQTRRRVGLSGRDLPNRRESFDEEALDGLLDDAVEVARARMIDLREEFEDEINEDLQDELDRLEELRERQLRHQREMLEAGSISRDDMERKKRSIERIFDEYFEWIEETMTTEEAPFIQVMAVLRPYDTST